MVKEDYAPWFARQVPKDWFVSPPTVADDEEELLVVGTLPAVELAAETAADARREAEAARIDRFREDTRLLRVEIAHEAERLFRRKVAWGATCGDVTKIFTSLSVPVMTRLRLSERRVLDTLVDAGVARSRSEALAWCVRLVGKHQADWIAELRDALVRVREVRGRGPA
jgi:hypothetical protein